MAEYIEREPAKNESICRSCFHSYVCEQFNEHRDSDNKKCHFYNDHYVPTANVVEVVRCKDCKFAKKMVFGDYSCVVDHRLAHDENDYCSYGERKGDS